MLRSLLFCLLSLIPHPSYLGPRLSSLVSRLSSLVSRLSSLVSRLSSLVSRLSSLVSRLSVSLSLVSRLSVSRLSSLVSRLSSLVSRLSSLCLSSLRLSSLCLSSLCLSSLCLSVSISDERAGLVEEAECDVADIQAVIRRMEIEIRSYPYNVKSQLQQKIKLFKNDVQTQSRDLKRASSARAYGAVETTSAKQRREAQRHTRETRGRLLEANAVTSETSESLENTRRHLHRAIDTGIDTTVTLGEQRHQLERARDDVSYPLCARVGCVSVRVYSFAMQ
jgi:Vesicle transport v-SNARE protein N-terminus